MKDREIEIRDKGFGTKKGPGLERKSLKSKDKYQV